MAEGANSPATDYREIGKRALERTRSWVERSTKYPTDRAAALLARVLKDPNGLDYTVSFVDGVIRPEDVKIAAQNLRDLSSFTASSGKALSFLPAYLRAPAIAGGKIAPLVHEVAVPAARKVFARLVGDLVVDVSDANLGAAIERLKVDGARLNMNLLGEAVLGDKEAERRLADTMELIKRPDVDYVSLKVSAVTGPHNPWGYNELVEQAVDSLLPLYLEAAKYSPQKFVNLDMEEYHDLHLTIEVFKRILERPELKGLEAGIVLQAYLPDALLAMEDLQKWAAQRVASGGSRIKVRVVKGANLAMERVQAKMHGWPLTTQPSKQATDANYIRVLDYALRPEHTANIRIGVAGHNLFTVALAFELAQERGVWQSGGVEFEMLSGMAAPQAAAVREDVGHLLYYVPVVRPEEYDVAIAYLVRRLEENAAPENFMSGIFDIADDQQVYEREQARFEAALEQAFVQPVGPNRTQNRQIETEEDIASVVRDVNGNWTFHNTPDTDPALPANLEWARQIASRMKDSQLGVDIVKAHEVSSDKQLDELIAKAIKAGKKWAALPAAERSDILHRSGVKLAAHRAELIEVAGSEAGKAFDQGDVEVSEATDFAHYYAQQALELDQIPGAAFQPSPLTVVTPPWNFPIAIPAGGCLAALASGSPVIFKPARVSQRTGAIVAQCLWEAGVPKDVLVLVNLTNHDLGKQLITDPRVDQVILTGSIQTAQMFRSWRKDLKIFAETSGKNAIVVTPSADLDLAVKDVVYSAFGHAGQKCSASSLVILVGSVAFSERFHRQLIDAVRSLRVSMPWDLTCQMGPLCEPAKGKLLEGLTTLGPGEHWAIKPHKLDDTGKRWTPGVRAGVKPGSEYHLTEYFGPILGVMVAENLEEAVQIQNQVDYGLTAGLHSLDADEINYWTQHVQAGNVYINRGITGAIVRRQPFGGWKLSAVGTGTKAGGPNYLYGLGTWHPEELPGNLAVRPLRNPALAEAAKAGATLPEDQRTNVLNALVSADEAIATEFGVGHDPSDLGVELNVLRYLPVPAMIRLSEGEPVWKLLSLVANARAVDSQVTVSSAIPLPAAVVEYFRQYSVPYTVEGEEDFLARVAVWSVGCGLDGRIRLIGGDPASVAQATDGSCDVAIYSNPVTIAGRVEVLPFVHEQAIAFTNHRFGNPTPLTKQLNFLD